MLYVLFKFSRSASTTAPESIQKIKPKSRDSSEEKMLSTKKNKNEKSRSNIADTSSDSSSEDEKPTKSTPVKSAAKRPKTPTKAKQPVKKGAKKAKSVKENNQPIYSKNTSDTSSEDDSSEESDEAEKKPIKTKNKAKAAQGKQNYF